MGAADNTAKQINDQLGKAKGELDTLIASLQDTSVDPATLAQLQETAQALDDIVPDQVVDTGTDTGTDTPPADEPTPA